MNLNILKPCYPMFSTLTCGLSNGFQGWDLKTWFSVKGLAGRLLKMQVTSLNSRDVDQIVIKQKQELTTVYRKPDRF